MYQGDYSGIKKNPESIMTGYCYRQIDQRMIKPLVIFRSHGPHFPMTGHCKHHKGIVDGFIPSIFSSKPND